MSDARNPHGVRPGQVWRDLHRRTNGLRLVAVVSVHDGRVMAPPDYRPKALVRSSTDGGHTWNSRTTEIALTEFKPHKFRLTDHAFHQG